MFKVKQKTSETVKILEESKSLSQSIGWVRLQMDKWYNSNFPRILEKDFFIFFIGSNFVFAFPMTIKSLQKKKYT